MKIMIVEDSSIMRKSIQSIVAHTEDTIIECIDGSSVLEKYSKEMPDVVLMDIDMPLKNGFDATRELLNKYPKARVIIVTNHNGSELREEAELAGAEKYFLKDNLLAVKNYLLKNWSNN